MDNVCYMMHQLTIYKSCDAKETGFHFKREFSLFPEIIKKLFETRISYGSLRVNCQYLLQFHASLSH